ncbi:hypothetical protein GCM10027565_16010 [Bordetella tumulicola]
MRLHKPDGVCGDTGGLEGGSDASYLPAGTAGRVAHLALAIVDDGRALEHCINMIAVAHGVGQPLDEHQAKTATEHDAIRLGVKSAESAGFRENVPRLVVIPLSMRHAYGDATGQRHVAFARQQARTRLVQSH